ncbi:M14 family zinc carboxypeptidase [Streptomyces sp. AM8-1-1]|uniref:M14 family zinc carboxypeptidase n=1 Tax=Streptomyces sp. AM8-1-1 TaxID=3075825 RepID=UPI0028C4B89A|nr:M14 family zinc carboxypeptidase [Streptomyces sp. AM8-1-1]WNO73223.1 M14 family zinc carboxypeptidase [Streptomyces sp. AM8-1-1]
MTHLALDRYLNVGEVDSALSGLAAEYPDLSRRVTLPYTTFEGRRCRALVIGDSSFLGNLLNRPRKPCVFFTACAHAREWGGAEICLSFAADLLEAYKTGAGLRYGGAFYDKDTIRRIIDELYVVVLPCVNPDGRNFSQTYHAEATPEARYNREMWRKNRSPRGNGVGVDINRNHSFLWDFRRYFSPYANKSSLASDNPGSDLFHGHTPNSEPETRNIHWLLDRIDKWPPLVWSTPFGSLAPHWYVDIHSFSNTVMHVWGHDENQMRDPFTTFATSRYDGKRGTSCRQNEPAAGPQGCSYAEFIEAEDEAVVSGGAAIMAEAIGKVRGVTYDDIQSFWLKAPSISNDKMPYPTSGTVTDYAYSRHLTSNAVKAHALVVEFGRYYTDDFPRSFHPPWQEMAEIIKEVSSGMTALCHNALTHPTSPGPLGPVQKPWDWPWKIWVHRIEKIPDMLKPLAKEAVRFTAAAVQKNLRNM